MRIPRWCSVAVVLAVLPIVAWHPASATGSGDPDPAWLQVDAQHKVAIITVKAAMNGQNSGMNFNGYDHGGLVFTVPVGWMIDLEFLNNDKSQHHGVEAIAYTDPMPFGPAPLAFPNAATDTDSEGLPPGSHASLHFTAGAPGQYAFRCTTGGHGMLGMWITLDVKADAAEPTMAARSAKS
jgi:uncharacterized cupredoxin-like copper-binding protein